VHLSDELQRHKLRVLFWSGDWSHAGSHFLDFYNNAGYVYDDNNDAKAAESELY